MNIKEAKMQNYKIKVANEDESKEAQELFFELGYGWYGEKKNTPKFTKYQYLYGFKGGDLGYGADAMVFKDEECQEITLPQLRDLVILHRNDVGDATHESDFVGHKFFVASDNKAYEFREDKWQPKICKSFLEQIVKQESQMTWQDALKKWIDGEEVEYFDPEDDEWKTLGWALLYSLKRGEVTQFRMGRQIEINGKKLNWEEADSELKAFFKDSQSLGEGA